MRLKMKLIKSIILSFLLFSASLSAQTVSEQTLRTIIGNIERPHVARKQDVEIFLNQLKTIFFEKNPFFKDLEEEEHGFLWRKIGEMYKLSYFDKNGREVKMDFSAFRHLDQKYIQLFMQSVSSIRVEPTASDIIDFPPFFISYSYPVWKTVLPASGLRMDEESIAYYKPLLVWIAEVVACLEKKNN